MIFEDFEFEAVTHLLASGGVDATTIDREAMSAAVVERKFTGVGFNTSFAAVPELIIPGGQPDRVIADTAALLNGATEVGLILKIEDSRISWLEGYTFASDRWPETLTDFSIYQDEVRQV